MKSASRAILGFGVAALVLLALLCCPRPASAEENLTLRDLQSQITDAQQACGTKGSFPFGSTISAVLGADQSTCTSSDSRGIFYADFYTVFLTAGHTVQATYIATGWRGIVAIQDFNTGNVLASSSSVSDSGSATYVVPSSTTYLVGVGAYGTGPYTLRVADVAATPPPSTKELLLLNGRFRVGANFLANGVPGQGNAVALSGDTGLFWFFSANAVEVVVKMVDGRSLGGHFWVFAGGLTNVEVTITVTDTQTNAVRSYHNPANTAFLPIQDTAAF